MRETADLQDALGLTKQDVRSVIDVYIKAWEQQDPDLIVTIFTENATYHERVLQAPIPGREAIRAYWESKVVGAQANIRCRLLNLYLDDVTATAEWEAEFDDVAPGRPQAHARGRHSRVRRLPDRRPAGVLGICAGWRASCLRGSPARLTAIGLSPGLPSVTGLARRLNPSRFRQTGSWPPERPKSVMALRQRRWR
jgi:hypothetical protein